MKRREKTVDSTPVYSPAPDYTRDNGKKPKNMFSDVVQLQSYAIKEIQALPLTSPIKAHIRPARNMPVISLSKRNFLDPVEAFTSYERLMNAKSTGINFLSALSPSASFADSASSAVDPGVSLFPACFGSILK